MAFIGLAKGRHPIEAYVAVGLRVYSDGTREPYIIGTGEPLAITDLKVGIPLDGAMTLTMTAYVEATEWVEVPKDVKVEVPEEAKVEGPVAKFADSDE